MKWIQAGIRSGNPIQHGHQRLTPRALVLEIHWPWIGGGFIYNHPIAVSVQTDGAQPKTIPIIDVTLIALTIISWVVIAARIQWRTKND